ncbi:Crp/Fnr family transcriptional regulator [Brevibacillus migulae]|uniref:Crp/Fnr family transcriptional regulator n=1 Tax=Brevibacillus migulae TaxID=1644114 RepID=UPI00106EF303|nr:Crp/Fnr family transcriptional regulator [Brevibacillus migulae]
MESILRNIPLFRELDEQEFGKILQIAIPHTYQRKANVFMEGEKRTAVFFIQEGIIKIYKTDINGNEQIVNFLKKGDMFPHVGFFDQSPYPATAEVVETAELIAIPIQLFEQTLLEVPSIAIKVMRVLGSKILELQHKLQAFSVHDVNYRIISILLRIAHEHGKQNGNVIQIDIPLTHQEFANMVGSTRETVNRLFNQLKKEEIIAINRKRITILDVEALEAFLE